MKPDQKTKEQIINAVHDEQPNGFIVENVSQIAWDYLVDHDRIETVINHWLCEYVAKRALEEPEFFDNPGAADALADQYHEETSEMYKQFPLGGCALAESDFMDWAIDWEFATEIGKIVASCMRHSHPKPSMQNRIDYVQKTGQMEPPFRGQSLADIYNQTKCIKRKKDTAKKTVKSPQKKSTLPKNSKKAPVKKTVKKTSPVRKSTKAKSSKK